jgi:hypothetical protein
MVVMIGVGVARHYVTILLNSIPEQEPKKIRESQALARSRRLRNPAIINLLTESSFTSRRDYLVQAFGEGKEYIANPEAENAQPGDPAQMEVMMEGMKKNMAMIIPQTLIMSWITFFFSGFILSKFLK